MNLFQLSPDGLIYLSFWISAVEQIHLFPHGSSIFINKLLKCVKLVNVNVNNMFGKTCLLNLNISSVRREVVPDR